MLVAFFIGSSAAQAGPTIVESGGYTFLPGLQLTGKGLLIPNLAPANDVSTLVFPGGTVLGSHTSFPGLWMIPSSFTPTTANYALLDVGSGLLINTRTGTVITLRVNNAAVATVNSTTMTFATGSGSDAIAFTTNGARLHVGSGSLDYFVSDGTTITTPGALGIAQTKNFCFDGATCAKKFSSDGTTLTLATLNLAFPFGLATAGLEVDGNVGSLTTTGVASVLGTVSGFPGMWNIGSGVTPSTSNYSILNAGPTLLNGPSGQGLGFRENNTSVLGTWTAAAGLSIGTSGTAIKQSNDGSATLDFASAAQATCSADLTITVTGATTAASVALSVINASVPTGSVFWAWISAADTVKVRHCCVGAATCDPASGVYHARTFNP